jgi:tocopherol O-methyltransferase
LSQPEEIAEYYDRNTDRFVRFGGAGRSLGIHRQLWGPGVETAQQASDYVNCLLADAIRKHSATPDRIFDFGCGIGGTVIALAREFPEASMLGVTLSEHQRLEATRLATETDVAERCRFATDNFEDLETHEPADVIVAVESFVHSTRPAAFFASAQRTLSDDGVVVIADDFLAREIVNMPATKLRHVTDFRAGWRLQSLCSVDTCRRAASSSGFELVEELDLTHIIRTDRLRDWLVAAAAPLARAAGLVRFPFFANLIGGNALRAGIEAKIFRYARLAFRKRLH